MTMTVLTCVACGKTLLVRDEPDEKRDRRCTCTQSMVERRRSGFASRPAESLQPRP